MKIKKDFFMKTNEKIIFLRKRAGISQEELANEMEVSRQAVYKWETGDVFPELVKMKKLAKFFDVSFDYLMNDEIDELEDKPKPKAIKTRAVFYTESRSSSNQADVDNGYTRNRNCPTKYEGYYSDRKKVADKVLGDLGATDVFYIQPHSTTAFFYDSKKKVCGFYYAGQVQFVCPVENVLDFSYSCEGDRTYSGRSMVGGVGIGVGSINSVGVGISSMPTTTVINGTTANATLVYTDNGSIKEITLSFNVNNLYLTRLAKSPEELQDLWALLMRGLAENLAKLQHKISVIKHEGQAVRNGEIEVSEVDYEPYKNPEHKEEYRRYLTAIRNQAEEDNRKMKIRKFIFWGVVIAVVVAVIVFAF